MYLAELTIKNFRKLRDAKLKFQPGLNVLVGPNNVGKSAVVDALRTLLAGHDEPYPRLDIADRHRPLEGEPAGDISFHFVFRDLSHDDEADFIAALKPAADKTMEAHSRRMASALTFRVPRRMYGCMGLDDCCGASSATLRPGYRHLRYWPKPNGTLNY